MKVIDLFCGAGGFSEGFRQAGFDIVLGIDHWSPAVMTFQQNQSRIGDDIALQGDIYSISLLPDDEFDSIIPEAEVIIGSPPCVSFSNSNRSGKADKSEGIKLVLSFLRIVARKKWKANSTLKYWIMENVPNSAIFIKDKYSAQELNLLGEKNLYVKNKSSDVYNATYFGVPSRRKRYLCGEFPEPRKTNGKESKRPLSFVLKALGQPFEKMDETISDPLYSITVPGDNVTDHHYLQPVAKHQWEQAKRLKQDKGYMGKMAFPENENKPARTIMATLTFGARESMILANNNNGYRAPTIREVASLMSFPVTYNFYGDSIATKYRLVGNAVPPMLSYALAIAILERENQQLLVPNFSATIPNCSFVNLNGSIFPEAPESRKKKTSIFKYHIPYMKINTFRVELTNSGSDFVKHDFNWRVELHRSQGKDHARKYNIDVPSSFFSDEQLKAITSFVDSLTCKEYSFNYFQEVHCMTEEERLQQSLIGPYELLERVRGFIDELLNRRYILSQEYVIPGVDRSVPSAIALGYYVLESILKRMQRNNE